MMLFFDNILDLKKVDKAIKKVSKTHEEKVELWGIVDEIIHHKVFGCVLEHLPQKHHREFLELFHKQPHDEKLLDYLKEKIGKDIKLLIQEAVAVLVMEIVGEIETGKARKVKKSGAKL